MTNPEQKETTMKKRKPLGLVFVAIIVSVAAVAAMVSWWQSRPQGSPVAGDSPRRFSRNG